MFYYKNINQFDRNKELRMKKLKPFDYVLIAIVIVLAIVFALVLMNKNKFSKSPVEANKKVAFQVIMRGVSFTSPESPFKVGEETFITIRNVPYSKLQIIDYVYEPKKTMLPSDNPNKPFIIVNDYSAPYQYDFIVTLIDDAKITKDGPVIGGNKLKRGLPIILEGFDYRFGGTIVDVKILSDEDMALVKQILMNAKKAQKEEQIGKSKDAASVEALQKAKTVEKK